MKSSPWLGPAVLSVGVFLSTRYFLNNRNAEAPSNREAPPLSAAQPPAGVASSQPQSAVQTIASQAAARPVNLSFKQRILIEYGDLGAFTWAAISRAERDLEQRIQKEIVFRSPAFLPGDCFAGEDDWSGFSYSLGVIATKERVTVGDFRIESSSMPRRVLLCLTEQFAGDATVEVEQSTPEGGFQFLEFETRLQRVDTLTLPMTLAAKAQGREQFLEKLQNLFLIEDIQNEQQRQYRQTLRDQFLPAPDAAVPLQPQ